MRPASFRHARHVQAVSAAKPRGRRPSFGERRSNPVKSMTVLPGRTETFRVMTWHGLSGPRCGYGTPLRCPAACCSTEALRTWEAGDAEAGHRARIRSKINKHGLRSRKLFNNPADQEMTALYLERCLKCGLTREELRFGRPVIGIARTGGVLSPCSRHRLELTGRIRDGARGADALFGLAGRPRPIRRNPAELRRGSLGAGLAERAGSSSGLWAISTSSAGSPRTAIRPRGISWLPRAWRSTAFCPCASQPIFASSRPRKFHAIWVQALQ